MTVTEMRFVIVADKNLTGRSTGKSAGKSLG
jgi:hypothetical protein